MLLSFSLGMVAASFAGDTTVYSLRTGNITFTVTPEKGGRIVSFTCNGKELLVSSQSVPEAYGGTLWPSPQRNWKWPPYPVLDTAPYTTVQHTGKVLKLISAPDPASGFQFEKLFSVSNTDTSISIIYTIKNTSVTTKQVAAWDVCRVKGGLTFFPVADTTLMPVPKSNPLSNTSVNDGILYYNFNLLAAPQPQKLFSTAKEGWLAHVTNGLLFVKTFPDISVAQLPPDQGEIEIYYQKDGQYIELENHGPYTTLLPGEILTYKEKWFLTDLKSEVKRESIVALARRKASVAHQRKD